MAPRTRTSSRTIRCLLVAMYGLEIAAELNKKGWRSSANQPFSAWIIYHLRTSHKLISRTERLHAKGLLNTREIAALVGTKPLLVNYWRQQELLEGIRLN